MIKKTYLSSLLLIATVGISITVNASSYSNQQIAKTIAQQNNTSTSLKHIDKPTNQTHINPTNAASPHTSSTHPSGTITPEQYAFDKKQEEERKAANLIQEKQTQAELATYKGQQAYLVDHLSHIDYHTQNPPKKLYERKPDNSNKHIPPVYFKSYYLALTFKAAEKNDNNGLNAVLSKYNFLNGQNKDGDTVLMHATQYNSLDSARLLLAKGAYVDAVNHRNRTALHYAATLGNLELIKLLLSMGANYTLTDDTNMTAVDYALANGQNAAAAMIKQYIEQNKLQ
jgi:hypothetical protein